MAGAGKAAILATLLFALLASASMVDAARPVVEQGSNVAADGRALVREGRQLRTFFRWRCGFFGWGCYRPFYHPYFFNRGYGFNGDDGDVRIRNDKHRRLNTFGRWHGWGWGWGGRWGGWGGWGWHGHHWGGYGWGRK